MSCRFLDDERAARVPQPKKLRTWLPAILEQCRPVGRNVAVGGAVEAEFERISEIWRVAVGDSIASVSRVLGFRQGVLRVSVSSSPVRSELEFARLDLIDALAESGLDGVHDVRFVAKVATRTRKPS
ncbi:MAG: DUF721 domain-containing protein [Planctomycetes bacterium]|nr:DUF721 domain-containing protein [Planctomycetota bacterium]